MSFYLVIKAEKYDFYDINNMHLDDWAESEN